MVRMVSWQCDGCDEIKKSSDIPLDWYKISLTLQKGCREPVQYFYDLCDSCSNNMHPKEWPRYGKEKDKKC